MCRYLVTVNNVVNIIENAINMYLNGFSTALFGQPVFNFNVLNVHKDCRCK